MKLKIFDKVEGDCFILSSILSILSSLGELYVSNIINEKIRNR